MSYSDHKKMLNQIGNKPGKVAKWKKHNTPKKRTTGRNLYKCKLTGRTGAHIHSYGIGLCRQAFREVAPEIGFKKYS